MRWRPLPAASLLRPILDTYKDSAVAVVGCNATGMARESCELDVYLISNDVRPATSVKLGDTFCDLYFLSEREALKPSDPEVAISLAQAKPVKDTSLVLSTSMAAATAVVNENARRASQARLASCLKALGRAEESLSMGRSDDANYWVLSASYSFASAWLLAREMIPSPSHLLDQLRELSKDNPRNFEAFTHAAGLEHASRKSCAERLDGLFLLYDLMASRQMGPQDGSGTFSEVSFQIVKRKAEQLGDLSDHAECYSFLGRQVMELLFAVSVARLPKGNASARGQALLSSLTDEDRGLLSRSLVRELGLGRKKEELRESLDVMKEQVSKLARKI